MPPKTVKKIADIEESIPTEKANNVKPLVGVSSSDQDQEELDKNLKEISELAEKLKQSQQQSKITVDNWHIPFGKWRGMLGKSLLQLETINKFGKKEPVGRKYLAFLLNLEYLYDKDKQIISQILCM